MKNLEVRIFNAGKNDLPSYSKPNDAGFDIRTDLSKIKRAEDFMGNKRYIFYPAVESSKEKACVILRPNGRILIPSNIHVNIPEGYEIEVRPRSGLAIKYGITIVNSPGTVDCGYLGGIGIILLNTDTENNFEIYDGDRIAQGILKEMIHCDWKEVSTIEELGETERGHSGFGDSGIK